MCVVRLYGVFSKQNRMIMAYSKLLLVPCALSRITKGQGLMRRKIIHVWFKSYNTEKRIRAELMKYVSNASWW